MSPSIIVAAAVGFFIGAVLVWIIKNTNQHHAEDLQEESDTLRQEHEALKKAFADYRNNVNGHFIRTADAVEQLADGYKNVYHQLSSGARALMDKETLQKQIEKRQNKTITLGFAADSGDSAPAAPAQTGCQTHAGGATCTITQQKTVRTGSFRSGQKRDPARSGQTPPAKQPGENNMKTTHHAFALLGATLLAACQADSNPGNISAGDSPRSGSQWVLVAGQLNGKPLNVQDGTVTLTQEKDAFTGVSAINHYRVPVKIRGGNIEHPEPPTTTLMAGPVEAMRLESDYLEAMSAVKHLKREGDSLTISGDNSELQFRPAPPQSAR